MTVLHGLFCCQRGKEGAQGLPIKQHVQKTMNNGARNNSQPCKYSNCSVLLQISTYGEKKEDKLQYLITCECDQLLETLRTISHQNPIP